MAQRYLIGIDLGTTSAKCVIYDVEGNVAAEASRDMVITYPGSGEAEQNAEDFYTVTCELIKKCLMESIIDRNDIAAVGIDSQMGGILAIDKDYNPAIRYDTPLDSRSGGENTWMHEQFGDLIIERNGSMSTFGNKILYWKKRDEWKNIHKFIQPSAFVAGRLAGLSGGEAYMDETFICFSGFADLKNSCWSAELCKAMDVDPDKLPRIIKSTDIIGEVCRKASADTGLPAGIPIAAGCGDQIAGFTGAGILEPGRMVDVSGTACILGLSAGSYTFDLENRTLA
ncbi:MAG: xylulose kinase, partial [Spirochaetales bacterium]